MEVDTSRREQAGAEQRVSHGTVRLSYSSLTAAFK